MVIGTDDRIQVDSRLLDKAIDAAHALAQVSIQRDREEFLATGLLITSTILLTSNRAISTAREASAAQVMFGEFGFDDRQGPVIRAHLEPERFFLTDKDLGYSLVAIKPDNRLAALSANITISEATDGQAYMLVYDAHSHEKQVVLRDLEIHPGKDPGRIRINYDKFEPHDSGAPIFDSDWNLCAMHGASVNAGIRFIQSLESISPEMYSRLKPSLALPESRKRLAGEVTVAAQFLNQIAYRAKIGLSWLSRLQRATHATAGLKVISGDGSRWSKTGFMVSSRLLLTVWGAGREKNDFRSMEIQFQEGAERVNAKYVSEAGDQIIENEALGYCLYIVHPIGGSTLMDKWLDLAMTSSVGSGDTANIIQFPGDKPPGTKWLAATNNEIIAVDTDFIQYLSDTAVGSSGAPVLNSQWELIGLHARVSRSSQQGNEGVPIGRIVEDIRQHTYSAEHAPPIAEMLHVDLSELNVAESSQQTQEKEARRIKALLAELKTLLEQVQTERSTYQATKTELETVQAEYDRLISPIAAEIAAAQLELREFEHFD